MLLKNSCFCTTHKSSVSTGIAEQIMSMLHTLCCNGCLLTWTTSWPSLYRVGTDRTENTAYNNYSIGTCYITVTSQWLFLWLHNSCFEQICHNTNIHLPWSHRPWTERHVYFRNVSRAAHIHKCIDWRVESISKILHSGYKPKTTDGIPSSVNGTGSALYNEYQWIGKPWDGRSLFT
jgi:hypothetical protein